MRDRSRVVSEVLEDAVKQLESANVPEAKVSASLLLAKVVGTNNIEVLDRPDVANKELLDDQRSKLDVFLQCRLSRMPVQYIVGDWDFRQLTLQMRPPVFIPRPETEELVGLVLSHIEAIHQKSTKVRPLKSIDCH